MAVAGEKAWQDSWVGIFGLFGRMETACFDHYERERAINWLAKQLLERSTPNTCFPP
jgi:hypothetical protein